MRRVASSMKLGFSLPVSGAWATPENQVRVAREAERLGYHSLWVLQRLLFPVAPQNDYPLMPGRPWPDCFESVADPVVSLAFVAGATSRIRLGTSVLVMPYYTPVMLAKQLATLDRVSGGRLDVGLGVGWSRDEYDAVGVPYEKRGRRADEFLACLKAIWTEDPVEFHGEFYRVPRASVRPRPLQLPHPPITVGGYGLAAVRRAVTFGDGFAGGNVALDRVAPLVKELRTAAERAGRDPARIQVVCRGTFHPFDAPQGPSRRPLFGSLDEIREDVRRYAELGLTELFLEGNVLLHGWPLERTLEVMTALAPDRTLHPG
ncbi:MAG TPA: LLM class F420-dependent oxidoreductase [Methylomirabilota bacterium]|jgi:probable F420-dependent oxidoreductase|nr:LLM class F420-dependent oxidoreductase [Methylomirabilota bacterium]